MVVDADYQRLVRDLEDLITRLREVESGRNPVLVERFRNYDDRIQDIKADVGEIKEDMKATRNMMRSALITSTLAIVSSVLVGIILYVILGAQ
jgi:hypothetical protein